MTSYLIFSVEKLNVNSQRTKKCQKDKFLKVAFFNIKLC